MSHSGIRRKKGTEAQGHKGTKGRGKAGGIRN